MKPQFGLSVVNDEIGQDFGRVCEVVAREFGLNWIEIRGAWNKNILRFDAREVAEALPHPRSFPAAVAGENPYPDGYKLLPKKRIGHCHCKDVARRSDAKSHEWAAVGRGSID